MRVATQENPYSDVVETTYSLLKFNYVTRQSRHEIQSSINPDYLVESAIMRAKDGLLKGLRDFVEVARLDAHEFDAIEYKASINLPYVHDHQIKYLENNVIRLTDDNSRERNMTIKYIDKFNRARKPFMVRLYFFIFDCVTYESIKG